MTHAVYGIHLFMQFYRMFRIQEHDRKSVRVVQVDVVDNGDLNIRYRKKKQQFEAEKKPVDELFVFHGTSGKILRLRIVLLYCI